MFSSSKTGNQPASGSSNDPKFNYVTLLLNGDGTNGGQNNTFIDGSSNALTVTRNGTPTQGSFSPYGDLWSNYFSGTTQYLTAANNTAFDFGSGSFTIEAWVYTTSTSQQTVVERRGTGFSSGDWVLFINESAGTVSFYSYDINSSVAVLSASSVISVNTWTHIAVVRNGSSFILYVNGVSVSTATSSNSIANNSLGITIGRDNAASGRFYYTGYLSNLRIVKGTAVYTSAFTPSTSPLTAITNTSILTCQSNRFKDNSSNAFTLTLGGTPLVQRFSPFEPSSSYSTNVIGGSGYFNGTTDFLTVAGGTQFDFSGDFTVELWFLVTASGTTRPLLNRRLSDGAAAGAWGVVISGSNNLLWADGLNGGTDTTIASSVVLNAWHHVAISRTGSTISFYYDGVRATTKTSSYNYTIASSTSRPAFVGLWGTLGGTWPSGTKDGFLAGYVSNARTINGTGIYSGTTITVPTAPLGNATNTSLLVTFDNAAIPDLSAKNDLITVGNTQISTTQKKHGTGSLSFDGSGDYLSIADNVNQQLLNGDFTIEGWVYLNSNGVAYGLISKGTSTTGWSVNITSGNKLQFSYTSSNLTGTTSLSATTWYHFAVVRNGSSTGNLKIYLNGVLEATSAGAVTDNFNQTSTLYVGADRVASSQLNGYLDDVRVSRGIVRYTAAFTPPTAALPTY